MKTKAIIVCVLVVITTMTLFGTRSLPSCDHCILYGGSYGGAWTLSGECYCTYPELHFVANTYDCYGGAWYCERSYCEETMYCTWVSTP